MMKQTEGIHDSDFNGVYQKMQVTFLFVFLIQKTCR